MNQGPITTKSLEGGNLETFGLFPSYAAILLISITMPFWAQLLFIIFGIGIARVAFKSFVLADGKLLNVWRRYWLFLGMQAFVVFGYAMYSYKFGAA